MRLLYFAWVRERIGIAEELVVPPVQIGTVADLVEWLAGRSEGHRAAFAEPARIRAAIDQTFVGLDAAIAGAAEIALFPPVTGG